MKFKDYLAFIFVASFLIVSVDLVLDYSGHHLLSRLTGYHFELVKTEENAKPKTSSASQKKIIGEGGWIEAVHAFPQWRVIIHRRRQHRHGVGISWKNLKLRLNILKKIKIYYLI